MLNHQSNGKERLKRPADMAIAALLAVLLAGCATGPDYKPRGAGGVGYSDQQLAPNRYMVSFSGSSAIMRATVEYYLTRRAAEVTLRAGYTHFAFNMQNTDSTTHYYFIGDTYLHGPDYARRAGLPLTYPNWPETRFSASAEIVLLRAAEAAGNQQAIDAQSVL